MLRTIKEDFELESEETADEIAGISSVSSLS